MNFKYLCNQYQLGRFQRAAELNPGTSSQVWKLDTDCGAFLVRTLKDGEQGAREWEVYRHLRHRGFTGMPAIVVPHFVQGGQWYQVQEYLTGTMPDPSQPGMAAALADFAERLCHAMPEGMIHGDFGLWNLLQLTDGRLAVIDFGEVRAGDPYFDRATLFAGVINHTSPEQRERVCREFIRELDCDRAHLLEQLGLWAEQGVRCWSGKNEQMTARFYHALNWAKEHLHEL